MPSIRINQPHRRVSAGLIGQLSRIPTANLSDVMARLQAAGPNLRPFHAGGVLAGPAFTVKTRPGDNLLIHKAIDMAQPGDVIVIDAGGDLTNALLGELMLSHAERRGIAGVVLNGAIRDLAHVRAHSFPVFAAGVTHRGPYKNGPGEINLPIALNGMPIMPGDAVVGDDDGVICVPFADVEMVIHDAQEKQLAEQKQMQAILAGRNDRSWVDAALLQSGWKIIHGSESE